MASTLDAEQVRTILLAACQAIIDAKEELGEADRAIGDGDHGQGMSNGFGAGMTALETAELPSVGAAFKTVGSAVLATAPSVAVALVGCTDAVSPAVSAPPAAQVPPAGSRAPSSPVTPASAAGSRAPPSPVAYTLRAGPRDPAVRAARALRTESRVPASPAVQVFPTASWAD